MAENLPQPQAAALDQASIAALADVIRTMVVEAKVTIDPTRPLQCVMALQNEVNEAINKLQAATNVATAKNEVGGRLQDLKSSLNKFKDAWETLSLTEHQNATISEEASYSGIPPAERMQLRMLSKMDTLVNKMTRPPVNRFNNSPSGVGMRCYNCNQLGHQAKDCPKKTTLLTEGAVLIVMRQQSAGRKKLSLLINIRDLKTSKGAEPEPDSDAASTAASDEETPNSPREVAPPGDRVTFDCDNYNLRWDDSRSMYVVKLKQGPPRGKVPPSDGRRQSYCRDDQLVTLEEAQADMVEYDANEEISEEQLIEECYPLRMFVPPEEGRRADLSRAFYSVAIEAEDGIAVPSSYHLHLHVISWEDILKDNIPVKGVTRVVHANNIVYSSVKEKSGMVLQQVEDDEKILNARAFRWKPGSVERLRDNPGDAMNVLGYTLSRSDDSSIVIGVKYRTLPEIWSRRSLLQWAAKCYDELGISGAGAIKSKLSSFAMAGIPTKARRKYMDVPLSVAERRTVCPWLDDLVKKSGKLISWAPRTACGRVRAYTDASGSGWGVKIVQEGLAHPLGRWSGRWTQKTYHLGMPAKEALGIIKGVRYCPWKEADIYSDSSTWGFDVLLLGIKIIVRVIAVYQWAHYAN
ncbi:hypothetical protein FOL47_001537 [Perkinsus chesapeaki]|uniref:CCHC-type domain-containing protein n=1 Tax=Perkinsus chesapeaki TaxID=330153 RepID=A0A7J6KRQ4_PERCH|nr:hypothetical protein FOL47_001537 [Perkinsus chesapeaki]